MRISISLNNSKKFFQTIEVKGLSDLAQYALKYSYSLGSFKQNHRCLENFKECEAIGLDIDNGIQEEQSGLTMRLDEAIEAFKDFKHLIMTSKSHQKEKNGRIVDRFRVILFLDKPIEDVRTFYATWQSLAIKYPAVDRQCKDASRFWFASPELVSMNEHGTLIEVVEQSVSNVIGQTRWTQIGAPIEIGGKGRIAQTTRRFISEGSTPGNWNGDLFKAAKDLQEQGYDRDEAVEMLERPTQLSGNLGHLDHNDITTINSAFSRPPRHNPRINYNENLRNTILTSNLIIDMADHTRTHLVNLQSGERFNVSKVNIKSLLSRAEFTEFEQYRVIYADFTYNPYAKKIIFDKSNGLLGYNMYTPPPWLRQHYYHDVALPPGNVPGCIDEFLNHLTNNDKASKEYIYDWLSTTLTSRNYTMLTAIGDQGIGKGVFGLLMEKLVGESNFKKTRDEVFKKSFNAQLADKRLIYVDELALTTKEAHDRMKDVVNETIEIEAKGKDAITITNHASFYLSSNHIDAIKLEPDDRRISAIELTTEPLLKRFSREQIEEHILGEQSVLAFARFLFNRRVERDMRIPFRSERFNEMMEAGLKNWQRFILYDLAIEKAGEDMSLRELQDRLRIQFPEMNPPGVTQFKKLASSFSDQIKLRQGRGGDRSIRFLEFIDSRRINAYAE